jgi:hypothetical protein
MSRHANLQRADRAMLALMRYAAVRFSLDRPVAIIDLVTDIGHFCDQYELPFEHLLTIAVDHWQREREEVRS